MTQRSGEKAIIQGSLQVADAVLRTELKVTTLDGSAKVSIPPGTQPDTILRLRGKGLPHFAGGERGDLYVRIAVHLPDSLTSEEQALFEKLRKLQH